LVTISVTYWYPKILCRWSIDRSIELTAIPTWSMIIVPALPAMPQPAAAGCFRATNAAIREIDSRFSGIVSWSSMWIACSPSMNRMISIIPVESTNPMSIREISSVSSSGSLT
jgi:hypothetical protein